MKRIVSLLLVLALSLSAQKPTIVQSPETTQSLWPFGLWPLCESMVPFLTASSECVGFVPGHEQYILLISTTRRATATAFHYAITATSVSTGAAVNLEAAVLRQDNLFGSTVAVLDFGGVVKDFSVVVQNLGPQ